MDRSPGMSVGRLVLGSSRGVVEVELKSESGELGAVTSCCSSGVTGLASEPLMAAAAKEIATRRSDGAEGRTCSRYALARGWEVFEDEGRCLGDERIQKKE